MTKQQKTYVLLTAVLIVWGLIGYQMYNRFNPKQEETATVITNIYKPKNILKVNSYTVEASYRDPFLGKLTTRNTVVKKKKKSIKKEKKKRFPKIIYNGIVEGKSQLFIITINNNQQSFQLKETIDEVTLLKGNTDEITLGFQDEVKTFSIQ